MARTFSLSYYTSAPLGPLEAVELVARLGYDYVGLRPAQPRPDSPVQNLNGDPQLLKDLVTRCRDAGVAVLDLEFIWLDAGFRPDRCKALAEMAAVLGARAIIVAGDDPEMSRLANSYARLCEIARPYGVAIDLEFSSIGMISNLASALNVVELAGRPENAGILIDSLHLFRSRDDVREIASIPKAWLHSAQICDAPFVPNISPEEIFATALGKRLVPGDGDIDLTGFLKNLPADLPLALEVPNVASIASLGIEEWCRRALAGARKVSEGPEQR